MRPYVASRAARHSGGGLFSPVCCFRFLTTEVLFLNACFRREACCFPLLSFAARMLISPVGLSMLEYVVGVSWGGDSCGIDLSGKIVASGADCYVWGLAWTDLLFETVAAGRGGAYGSRPREGLRLLCFCHRTRLRRTIPFGLFFIRLLCFRCVREWLCRACAHQDIFASWRLNIRCSAVS
jgi:hypothetical protein